jgi:pyruvate/2-oxoglutarate dehydrogenase complex dihydrolipoamide acyltransferase (E2) component
MADVEMRVPADLWEEDTEAALSAWLYADGDAVHEGDVICELMVEKVTFEVAAPVSGKLRIIVPKEATVARGDLVATIET